MRSSRLTLIALFVLLFAGSAVLAGCGGDDESSGTATVAEETADESGSAGDAGEGDGGESDGGNGDGGANAGDAGGNAGQGSRSDGDQDRSARRQHNDSGGGSGQFRTPGGDNSIQDFGQEAGQAEFRNVAGVLHDFLDARAELDWDEACRYVSEVIVESLMQIARQAEDAPDSCAGLLGALSGALTRQMARQLAQADVGSVRIEGDRAFVLFKGAEDVSYLMPMSNEDGDWKVAAIAASPLP